MTEEAAIARLSGSRRSVLVVDDDEAVRLRVRDLLERRMDCDVQEAAGGAEGIALACEQPPDLILLDLMMPGLTGLEVCRRLRADPRTRDVPIVVLSAAEIGAAHVAALEAGAEDFLSKPIVAPELKAKVDTVLRLNRYRVLMQERRRLRWVVDQSREALVIADRKGALVHANARARELFGLSERPGGDIAVAVLRHFQADPPQAWEELSAREFRPGPPFALVRPESALLAARWLEVEVLADELSDDGRVLLKFTDRSGQVQRELETWTFHHLVSHKLRTPLNGMGSILDLLADDAELKADPARADLLELARSSARRLEETVLGVLRYLDCVCAERPRPPGESVALAALVEASARQAGLPPERLFVSAVPEAVATSQVVDAVRLALEQVVENYVKFSEAPKTGLTVGIARVPTGEWMVEISAPGPDLPPDALAQLGRPYWQLEGRFSGEVRGVGLGLATVRRLLCSLGGDLRFRRRPSGPGLMSVIVVPAARALPT